MSVSAQRKKVNIGGSTHDEHHRYMRDEVEITYLRKKGVQTKITNLSSIIKDLNITPEEIVIILKKGLNTSVKGDILNGHFDVSTIETVLKKFTNKHILCPKCKKPELTKKRDKCKSCSYTNSKHRDKSDEKRDTAEVKILKKDKKMEIISQEVGKYLNELYDLRNTIHSSDIKYKVICDSIDHAWDIKSIEELEELKNKLSYLFVLTSTSVSS